MKVELVPFELSHLEQIQQRPVFHDKPQIRESVKELMIRPGSHMGTIKLGEKILAVVGIVQIRAGFAEAWTLTSDEIKEAPLGFHKMVLAMIRHAEKRYSIRRLQMTVKADYADGKRWAESLGFVKEGVMRHFDVDGSNHILYARVNSHG
jgi:hypothetical protein